MLSGQGVLQKVHTTGGEIGEPNMLPRSISIIPCQSNVHRNFDRNRCAWDKTPLGLHPDTKRRMTPQTQCNGSRIISRTYVTITPIPMREFSAWFALVTELFAKLQRDERYIYNVTKPLGCVLGVHLQISNVFTGPPKP